MKKKNIVNINQIVTQLNKAEKLITQTVKILVKVEQDMIDVWTPRTCDIIISDVLTDMINTRAKITNIIRKLS